MLFILFNFHHLQPLPPPSTITGQELWSSPSFEQLSSTSVHCRLTPFNLHSYFAATPLRRRTTQTTGAHMNSKILLKCEF
ncbi:hypothetical protein HanRHA438_Chr14g0680811 [Helianthus annuus]|nr:hypothetical protein HanRHA438_Chr14g0680811 [Helianthus annuus]